MRKLILNTLIVFLTIASFLPSALGVNLKQVPWEELPAFGTFWLASPDGRLTAPLPCRPDNPKLPVFQVEEGVFLVGPPEGSGQDTAAVFAISAMRLVHGMTGLTRSSSTMTMTLEPFSDISNHEKFAAHAFTLLDTNSVATNNPALYTLCTNFPTVEGSLPVLQVVPLGADALVFKASHFDYSSEIDRDFALIVCDKVETPVWKEVYLSNSTNSQGWLVQGLVPRHEVSDPMFLLVTNISKTYNAFFRVVPYGGPVVQLVGAQPYDTVSDTLVLTATVTDLSGATNQQLTVDVDGVEARYSVAEGNTVLLETPYTPNGIGTIYVKVANDNAMIDAPETGIVEQKLYYFGVASIPVYFENETYLYFAGNNADPDILVNYLIFGVTPPQYIEATIAELATGRILKSFAGYADEYELVRLDWDFTETDGITVYTNDEYVVSFAASPTPALSRGGGSSQMVVTNRIERSGVRRATAPILTYQTLDDESSYNFVTGLNFGYIDTLYRDVYLWYGLTQYAPGQIGWDRGRPEHPYMPFTLTGASQENWPVFLETTLTNWHYSDFVYLGHGNGYKIGGQEPSMRNTTVNATQVRNWILQGRTPENDKWYRMRRVELWACYTMQGVAARAGGFLPWPQTFGITSGTKQARGLMRKNVGLFFLDKFAAAPYGVATGSPVGISDVIANMNMAWVCGLNPYPGGSEPTWSYRWALASALATYPELQKGDPFIEGCIFMPYSGIYDENLMNLIYDGIHL
jgi:hypothetical protein